MQKVVDSIYDKDLTLVGLRIKKLCTHKGNRKWNFAKKILKGLNIDTNLIRSRIKTVVFAIESRKNCSLMYIYSDDVSFPLSEIFDFKDWG